MRIYYPEQEPGRERSAPYYREQERRMEGERYRRESRNYNGYRDFGNSRDNPMEDRDRMDYTGRMRSIGFATDSMRRGTSMHGGGKHSGDYEMGRAPMMEHGLSDKDADEWVRSMKGADGSKGGKWKYEDVERLLKERGIKCDPLEMWVGMNALYSDLCEVMTGAGITDKDVDFWLKAACAYWLADEDAVDDKLSAYYYHVVK